MSGLKEMWDSHKVTIVAVSVLILAILMVGAVFLAPGLYVVVTLGGFILIVFGGKVSQSRTIQYIGILVAIIGIIGLTVLQVSSLIELGIIAAVVGFIGFLFAVYFSPD